VLIGLTVNQLQRLVGWSTVLFITWGLLASLKMGVSQSITGDQARHKVEFVYSEIPQQYKL